MAAPPQVSSTDLKQTVVVPTLDSPLPEHKNVIWCATFQLAWDQLKNEIVREPIVIPGAEDVVDRLNRAPVSPGDLEPESFYAAVGLVSDGIVEKIQKEMAKQFPAEPQVLFDERYKTSLPTIVAYSYLSIDVRFKHPFYDAGIPLEFGDSSGMATEVTSFCDFTPVADGNRKHIREQVDILYCEGSERQGATGFALDPCKYTSPYQIVLARMRRSDSLGHAVTAVQEKSLQFKKDPKYSTLRKLQRKDEIMVPDILYKLEHHFAELEGKSLGNPKLKDYPILEARQMIDFALSRTGLVLKSEARFTTVRSGDTEVPRLFYFDRPFLIYVTKRNGGTRPFFAMWVNNAELMKKWPEPATAGK
jgi:hypothetical protein